MSDSLFQALDHGPTTVDDRTSQVTFVLVGILDHEVDLRLDLRFDSPQVHVIFFQFLQCGNDVFSLRQSGEELSTLGHVGVHTLL